MVDGTIARITNSASEFGARLDTVSDFVFMTVALIKFAPHFHIPIWLWVWSGVIATIKICNAVCGLVRTGKFTFPHTVLNKATGLAMFVLPVTLCFIEATYTLPIVCVVATAAAIHEGHYMEKKYDT